MPKNTKISLNNYTKLLAEIQNHIKQTQDQIVKNATREKVALGWEIGKIVDLHLSKNNQSGYGEKLFTQLANDLSISERVLYQMRNFFQTYPKLPKDDDRLNWTHYRTLSGVKENDERKRLEEVVRKNGWSTAQLEEEVQKIKSDKKISLPASSNPKKIKEKKLIALRGKLFSYPLIQIKENKKTYIDCGFNIFRDAEEALVAKLPKADVVDVKKKKDKYSLEKSEISLRKFNTYKAYIERVVDGDTIRVTIDLGFNILHKEILRLKGINAPEMNTAAGKKSARVLNNILKNVPFVILKTMKIDIYGRYVADVFLSDDEKSDPQKIADAGIYLNQVLLAKGAVEML